MKTTYEFLGIVKVRMLRTPAIVSDNYQTTDITWAYKYRNYTTNELEYRVAIAADDYYPLRANQVEELNP